ncbi:hypothetical protein NM688_g2111 [Phlebia brevispora]|uniref:Uncharacterized protein n=1 Tax=Phlebia brevispora TaxID=194682 RepID=A0ACC1T9A8_9APHY|nr:hypothetical protein NM688_g2111 [Phlebia brevispora]
MLSPSPPVTMGPVLSCLGMRKQRSRPPTSSSFGHAQEIASDWYDSTGCTEQVQDRHVFHRTGTDRSNSERKQYIKQRSYSRQSHSVYSDQAELIECPSSTVGNSMRGQGELDIQHLLDMLAQYKDIDRPQTKLRRSGLVSSCERTEDQPPPDIVVEFARAGIDHPVFLVYKGLDPQVGRDYLCGLFLDGEFASSCATAAGTEALALPSLQSGWLRWFKYCTHDNLWLPTHPNSLFRRVVSGELVKERFRANCNSAMEIIRSSAEAASSNPSTPPASVTTAPSSVPERCIRRSRSYPLSSTASMTSSAGNSRPPTPCPSSASHWTHSTFATFANIDTLDAVFLVLRGARPGLYFTA